MYAGEHVKIGRIWPAPRILTVISGQNLDPGFYKRIMVKTADGRLKGVFLLIYPFDGIAPVIDETAFIAPGAVVVGRVEIGPRAGIWYNAVVRGDVDIVKIGAYTNIQDGSVLHEDDGFPLYIGEKVTVGHRVLLHGCTVEDGAFIGMGATILNGARIGAGVVVGAGSLVLQGREIPPGVLAAGSPARVIRPLKEEELEKFQEGVNRYLRMAELHGKLLKD